jgi:hypothetical protein
VGLGLLFFLAFAFGDGLVAALLRAAFVGALAFLEGTFFTDAFFAFAAGFLTVVFATAFTCGLAGSLSTLTAVFATLSLSILIQSPTGRKYCCSVTKKYISTYRPR